MPHTIDLCTDCWFTLHGLPLEDDQPQHTPLSRLTDGIATPIDLTDGYFSWQPCDGCNDTLGGTRFVASFQYDEEQ